MTMLRIDRVVTEKRTLATRLEAALRAARGDMKIRRHLTELVSDPDRFDPIVRWLGPGHALVRSLRALAHQGETQLMRGA